MSQGLRTGEPSTFQAERQEEPSPHGRPSAGPGCTALRPTGSALRGPLPSKSHSQVRSSLLGGEEAAGRSPKPQQCPSPAQGSPDPASFSPTGGAQQQAAPLALSLRPRDIPEGSSIVWEALHKQAGLPHPALMWWPLPTLQEAQQAASTRPSLRNTPGTQSESSSSPCSPFTFIRSLLCLLQLLQSRGKALLGPV